MSEPVDLEAVRKAHVKTSLDGMSYCVCGESWPCDAIRLAEEVKQTRRVLRELDLVTPSCAQVPCTEKLFGRCGECVACRARIFTEQRQEIARLRGSERDYVDTIEAMLKAAGWNGTLEELNAEGTKPSHYIQGKFARLRAALLPNQRISP